MRALRVDRWMHPRELVVCDVAEPVPGPAQVLVDVRAAGCNFFDALQVQGRYQVRPALPFVPGGEFAGVVRAVGARVTDVAVGDRVMAGLAAGAFAERAVADATLVSRVPETMSLEHAAAVPVTYMTSYAALTLRASLAPGETVLVTAAAGGVGTATIQVARALGARVIAATTGEAKCALARALGADVVVDYAREGWEQSVVDATDGRGVDVVVECVGGAVFDAASRALAFEGRVVVVGFAGGQIPEIKANRLLLRNVSVAGIYMGLYVDKHPARFRAIKDAVLALCERGVIRPHVSRAFPLEQAGEALVAMMTRQTMGKVIVVP